MKNLKSIFKFEDSRKVSFGVYLFIIAGFLLCIDKITANDWLTCMFLSSTLVGGGTVIDTYLKGKNDTSPSNNR